MRTSPNMDHCLCGLQAVGKEAKPTCVFAQIFTCILTVPFPLPFNNGTSIYDVCFEGEGLVQEEKKLGRLMDYIIYMLLSGSTINDKPLSIPVPSPPAVTVAQFLPSLPLLTRLVSRSVNLDDPAGSWLVHTAFYCLTCPPHSIPRAHNWYRNCHM